MKVRLIAFGELEIDGVAYTRDVVIDAGRVRSRHKGPSKALRDQFGHTPLSVAEAIPWGGRRLIVGTGADGALPIAPDVYAEAARRGITVSALPTRDACRLLRDLRPDEVHAVLHITC
ncbi:MAG: MTH938/NDUFAF3 family protein [Candidatus Limnocylindrales bacterium]